MAFGVMGGHMQPQGQVQLVLRTVLHGQNPQAACDAPRWHVTEDSRVALEPEFHPDVAHSLGVWIGSSTEQRLRASSNGGPDFGRRRQLLVFDRFLARIVSGLGEAATLKAGPGICRSRARTDPPCHLESEPVGLARANMTLTSENTK